MWCICLKMESGKSTDESRILFYFIFTTEYRIDIIVIIGGVDHEI